MCGEGTRGGGPALEAQPLLGPLRHPCDLDLLLFFHRHPRVLMISERLAAYVGHDVKQIERSLTTLLDVGVLERSPNPAHEARLYALRVGADREWFDALLAAAAPDDGRRVLLQALKDRASERNPEAVPGGPASADHDTGGATNA